MRTVTRNRVQDLSTDLHEWHKYVNHLSIKGDGSSVPTLADEHPETIAKARELARDFAAFGISAPHLDAWLHDAAKNHIPDQLMIELYEIAMSRQKRNGLSFDAAVNRKKSSTLRDAIVAVRNAIPHVRNRYARDEELPMLLDDVLDPSVTTANGSAMEKFLGKLHDVLNDARRDHAHPMVENAVKKLAVAMGR